ncbi:MAG: NIPSNAP family protein [Planctomycetota bacterium]|nr:NIPSNAP family protein [Planctomycetota bacterium]
MSVVTVLAMGAMALIAGQGAKDAVTKEGKTVAKAFELRIYHTHPGRMPALEKRFIDHSNGLLEKHGMKLVGFWKPVPAPEGGDTVLIYLVEHASREAADKSWDAFRKDEAWLKARAESEKDGPIVKKVDVQWWGATPYSALR